MSSWTPGKPTIGLQRGDVEKRVAELERLVGLLMKVIKTNGIDVSIESPGSISIKTSATVSINASTVSIKASAMASINASIVKLNDGTKPVVRVGDTAIAAGPVVNLVTGNPTVMA